MSRINVVASVRSDKYNPSRVIARVEVWQNAQMIEIAEKSFARRSAASKYIQRIAQDAYERLEGR